LVDDNRLQLHRNRTGTLQRIAQQQITPNTMIRIIIPFIEKLYFTIKMVAYTKQNLTNYVIIRKERDA